MKVKGSGQAEALSKGEFRTVLESIAIPHWRLAFALCWYTTERPGAILKLQVEHVYQSPRERIPLAAIVIPRGIRKDNKTREVPVSLGLRGELKIYDPPLTGWLFPSKNPEQPLGFSGYSKALAAVYKSLGMKGYSTYSTRRGSLTHLTRSGFSSRQIQAVSGHASLGSLQKYLDVAEAEVRAAVDTL